MIPLYTDLQKLVQEHCDGVACVNGKLIEAALRELIEKHKEKLCEWHLGDEENGIWESSCGEAWSFIDGGPQENRVSYCHHCGYKVSIKQEVAA